MEKEEDKRKELETRKELHLRKAQKARDSLNNDKQIASDKIYVATFDLQKALPFPKLSTSIAYYKKNLYVYNLGVHAFNENIAYMHMYDEITGGRGSQDIASCLVKHLKSHANTHESIILYSDSCTGQNRNIKTSLSLLKLVNDPSMNAQTIDLKFLVSGHSYLPNDADFGIIESASRKKSHIYNPKDWMDIAREAKKKAPKFEVIEMKREEFMSTKELESVIQNRKKTIDGYQFSWLNIRWLRFEKGSLSFKFKETLNDYDFHEVDLKKAAPGRPPVNINNINQSFLYPKKRPVTTSKKQHMTDLLPHIPPVHHSYYKSIPVEKNTRNNKGASADNGGDSSSSDEITYDN